MSETTSGILKIVNNTGVLLDPLLSCRPKPDDVQVPTELIQAFRLEDGAQLTGLYEVTPQGRVLTAINDISGLAPEAFRQRTPYQQLVAIDPRDRFHLAAGGDASMRIIDLVTPIGKGTRGLIVSPPKAGKTTILEKIARAIRAEKPAARIIILLIDERPEEVTQFQRAVAAEVFYSSNDQSVEEHVALTELTLAHIRTELECGRDVVVLVDSLTRMSRAFNLYGRGSGRTLSGGMDARAMEIPRRFFGLARNIENGGSVTILATILVDTGSRMDQIIFEEFKGTGNSEIVLDRSLAEERIFPAINVRESGTRKEERLFTLDEYDQIVLLRRGLAGLSARDAMNALLKLIGTYRTNAELLQNINKARFK